jgi:SAM-dependent methyltransferase
MVDAPSRSSYGRRRDLPDASGDLMADRQTLDVYAERASEYSGRFSEAKSGRALSAFIDALPDGARVLDLGCGPGTALAHMARAGLAAEGLDASPEFAALARKTSGAPIRVGTFEDLDAVGIFDGLYANFSLLHAPKADMPAHLTRIAKALKAGGLLHIGLKTGTGETRDGLGRFYAYYEDGEITALLEEAGFVVISRLTGSDEGLDGTVAPWIILHARRCS